MIRGDAELVNAARAQSAIHFAIRFADTLQTQSRPLFSRLRMEDSPC